jgi:ribosome hibernation promoting factor
VEISISTKHGHLSDAIQQTIRDKVQRLPRFFDRTTAIRVIIDLEHSESPLVELRVTAEETNDFFAADKGANVLTALDRVVQKLEQQMRKHKEKLTEHRGKSNKHFEPTSDE